MYTNIPSYQIYNIYIYISSEKMSSFQWMVYFVAVKLDLEVKNIHVGLFQCFSKTKFQSTCIFEGSCGSGLDLDTFSISAS